MKNKILDLTIKLCEIPSITNNELACMEFLFDYLEKNGFLVDKLKVDEKRYNIFAYFEKKSKYNIILCTHIDTVPPFITPKLADDTLFGRGVCDAKGIAACMIFSALGAKAQGQTDMALLFTVGEETISDGAKAVNDILADRANYIVVGEPTENRFARSQKGALVFEIEALGIEAHSSTPELGRSATHDLILACNDLINYPWPNTKELGETLINIGLIEGGEAKNILAKSAKASGVMRLSMSVLEAQEQLKVILNNLNNKDKISIKIISFTDPFFYFVPANKPSFIAGFSTDAPFLYKVGTPILVGPGSLKYAHRYDEQIGVDDLYNGFNLYYDLLMTVK